MITLNKPEIARQNNILSIFFETPKISQITFSGEPMYF